MWSVLPQLTVELEIAEVTGTTATLSGVSLGWTVKRLGRAIGELRGVAPELLRLIVNEQALDNKGSLLLPACGICAGGEITRVHVVPQTAEQIAARLAAAASAFADGGAIEEGQPSEEEVLLLLCGRGGAAAACAARRRRRRISVQ